ncbi:hypothetical protein RHSIM_Rhsim09G0106900 [Rhododendron simsii]|uniref:Uncharacterized protein n=1 Tax=Rhododendron simsii TaxID=118357 RepID=A0A834LC61_RHOSS|nr:hypothetical protein RHSIM_Rhsim09G0106900 [Rhododendron simsii]
MITDFVVLQNPSLFSRVFPLSSTGEFLKLYSFWQWGALILALVATFTALITTIRLSFVRFVKSLDSSVPPIEQFLDESDSDTDSVDSPSTASSDDEGYSRSTSFCWSNKHIDEDFSVAGSSPRLRRLRSCVNGFSWSDFAKGKSVVKLWDSLGLEFDFEDDFSESVVSIWDSSTSSPAVVFSAGTSSGNSNDVLFSAYDARIGGEKPAMRAEWPQPRRRGKAADVGFKGGVEKVYVRDDATGEVTVGDLRKIRSPLEDGTESDGDTWWDADAVIGSNEFVDY